MTASYYNNGLSFTLTADFNNSASFNSGYDQNICGAPPIEMQRDFSTTMYVLNLDFKAA